MASSAAPTMRNWPRGSKRWNRQRIGRLAYEPWNLPRRTQLGIFPLESNLSKQLTTGWGRARRLPKLTI